MDNLVARLESLVVKLGAGDGGDDGEGVPFVVTEYNNYYTTSVQPFVDACNAFDDTKKIGADAEKAFKHLGVVIEMQTQCKKPADEDLGIVFGAMGEVVGSQNPDNRATTFPQQKSFAEALSCLNWICDPLPKPVVTGALDAADFYLNKALTAAKDLEDPDKTNRRAYVIKLKAMLKGLEAYVLANFKTGLNWKASGIPLKEFKQGEKAAAPAAAAVTLESRMEAAIEALEKHAASAGGDDEDGVPAFVKAWQEFYTSTVTPFIDTCKKLDDAKAVVEWTEKSFGFMSTVIKAASQSKKPDDADFMKFVQPIVDVMTATGNPDNRKTSFPFEKSFAEGVQSLSWIMMPVTAPHVTGQLEAATFYLNKVLTAAKDKEDPVKSDMRAFVKQFKEMMSKMAEYCKEYHKTGLSWNMSGAAFSDFSA